MPIMSLAVVIKGPDAIAGLTPILSSNSGVTVPIKEAKTTTDNKEKQTTRKSLGSPIR